MPATVSSSRSRKADDAAHHSQPAAKKQRLDQSALTTSARASATTKPARAPRRDKSLGDVLLTNGSAKSLEAKITGGNGTAHVVNDAASRIGTVVGLKGGAAGEQDGVIEISSDSDSDEDEGEDEEEDDEEEATNEDKDEDEDEDEVAESQAHSRHGKEALQHGTLDSDGDAAMADDMDSQADDMDSQADDEEEEDPTFGELLAAAPIDVQSALAHTNLDSPAALAIQQRTSTRTGSGADTLSSAAAATSLATVLSQALKTNDRSLLETCLATNDLASVRTTIQRLPSAQVCTLLHHIADKLHKRPGRASVLMVWIQWSLVAHGGYLARRADIVAKLGQLNRVIRERAAGLQPLLVLKGKLDMLAAQLELRREVLGAGRREMDEEDDVVIYVEGQEEDEQQQQADDDASGSEADVDGGLDDLDARIAGQKTAEQVGLDDDDEDKEEDDEDDESASDAGFSDQEVQQDESEVDVEDSHEDDEDDDSEDDEEDEQTISSGKRKRKA